MNCNHTFPIYFTTFALGKSYMKTKYKEHRKKVLFDRVADAIYAIRPYVDIMQEKEDKVKELKLQKQRYAKQRMRCEEARIMYQMMKDDASVALSEYKALLRSHTKAIADLEAINQGIEECTLIISRLEQELKRRARPPGAPCPAKECPGVVLGDAVCNACGRHVCLTCTTFVNIDAEHTCDPNTLANAAAVSKLTNNCPVCHVAIQKNGGCNQMYCTHCKARFDWKTGKIYKKNEAFLNPHLVQENNAARAALQRNVLDLPCGGAPTYQDFNGMDFGVRLRIMFDMVHGTITLHYHNENLDTREDVQRRLQEYVLKKIDRGKLEDYLLAIDMDSLYYADMRTRMVAVRDVLLDMMQRLHAGDVTLEDIKREYTTYANYTNDQFCRFVYAIFDKAPRIMIRSMTMEKEWDWSTK
jgi:hypothetical protein